MLWIQKSLYTTRSVDPTVTLLFMTKDGTEKPSLAFAVVFDAHRVKKFGPKSAIS